MKKFILPAILCVLLMASAVFNIVQYNQTKMTGEKLAYFESHIGTYENVKKLIEERDKMEHTITIYAKTTASESQILALKNLLSGQGSIQSIQYVSAEKALADFKDKHKNDEAILKSLDELGTNPLEGSLIITITDPAQKRSLIDFIKANDKNSIIDAIN